MISVHERALVWDNHVCLPFDNLTRWAHQLARHKAAGVNVVSVNIGDSDVPFEQALHNLTRLRAWISKHARDYMLAPNVNDIRTAQQSGRLAIFFDIEGGAVLGGDIGHVSLFYRLGVRWMLFVYNTANALGGGCQDDEDQGLTPFGRRVAEEMDRVGMLKDCSHTGYRTARDILEMSQRPVIFSHSNPRALCDHPRNIPDDLIEACGRTGGVVCLNGVGIFLGDNDIRVARLVDHIDHVAQLIGAEHVGLGLDYPFDVEGLNAMLAERQDFWPAHLGYRPGMKFMAPEDLPAVTEELLRRGYSDHDVCAILGQNLLRVAAEVWR